MSVSAESESETLVRKRSEDPRDYWTLSSVPFSHSRSCTGSLAYNSMCPQVSHTPMDTGAEYHGPFEADERAKSNSNVPVTLLGCLHLAEAIPVPPPDGLESSTAMSRQRHGLRGGFQPEGPDCCTTTLHPDFRLSRG